MSTCLLAKSLPSKILVNNRISFVFHVDSLENVRVVSSITRKINVRSFSRAETIQYQSNDNEAL
jgi:hypothetical protein